MNVTGWEQNPCTNPYWFHVIEVIDLVKDSIKGQCVENVSLHRKSRPEAYFGVIDWQILYSYCHPIVWSQQTLVMTNVNL